MAPTKICKEAQEWIDIVEQDKIRCCEEQHLLVAHIKKCFETEDIYTDTEQLGNYIRIIEKYLPFKLFPWEKFVLALHDCTYWTETKQPRWPDLFCMTGRGAGKDGMIAAESLCLSSQYNGIREYDVDICANNEEQALRPVQDLKMAFEEPKVTKQIKRFYHWTKERIVALKTRSIIRGRTNSPKGKDGLRSGIVIFNEIHQYQNYDNIHCGLDRTITAHCTSSVSSTKRMTCMMRQTGRWQTPPSPIYPICSRRRGKSTGNG